MQQTMVILSTLFFQRRNIQSTAMENSFDFLGDGDFAPT
jgi:hypothetical protein